MQLNRRTVDYNVQKLVEAFDYKANREATVTTPAQDRQIAITSKRTKSKKAPEIAAEVNIARENPISVSTVSRRFQDSRLARKNCNKKTGS